METGLDWKQQERRKERKSGALPTSSPLLLCAPPHSPSETLLFKHAMHFQTNYGFSMEPERAGDRSVCPTICNSARKTFKGKSCNTLGVLFSAQTASQYPRPPPAWTPTTTTLRPCLPRCNNTMSAPNYRPLLWAIMATVLAERAVGGERESLGDVLIARKSTVEAEKSAGKTFDYIYYHFFGSE